MTTPVSSNLNVDSIVNALMKPYQAKVDKIDKDISSYQVKISEVSKLKSSLNTLKTDLEAVEGNEKTPLTPEKLKAALQEFVKGFNATLKTTQASNDVTVKRFTQKLRDEIDPVTSAKIGISFDKTGQAIFDEAKFDSLDSSNHDALNSAVNTIFDKALGSNSNINNILSPNGRIESTSNMYQKKITDLNTKKDKLEDKMTMYETNYRRQFINLQKTLVAMDSNYDLMSSLIKTSA
jgi:flagellar capping protein FliD